MDDIAVVVAEYLDLDVPRLFDVLLDKDPIVGEARFRFARRRAEAFANLGIARSDPHPFAATPGRRLDHHRIADIAGDRDRALGVRDDVEVVRHTRYPRSA